MKTLDLEYDQIRDVSEIGTALRTNTSLTELRLYSNQVADVEELCDGLRLNRTLHTLHLYGNIISEEDQNRVRQAKSDVLRDLVF